MQAPSRHCSKQPNSCMQVSPLAAVCGADCAFVVGCCPKYPGVIGTHPAINIRIGISNRCISQPPVSPERAFGRSRTRNYRCNDRELCAEGTAPTMADMTIDRRELLVGAAA